MLQAETQHTNSYDVVPYTKRSHRHAHPRHLETLASLLGMTPAPIRDCRVLELGCAAGSNLIPQALELTESHFLGIDLSQQQIRDGQQTVAALGLQNIELRHADILGVDESWGQFDYILCHGVFSWVPPQVQGKILDICQRNLRPNGVAMVSYNTYPGWHLKKMLRELMLYHSAQFADPRERITQSLGLLGILAEMGDTTGAFARVIQEETEILRQVHDASYLFHEYLEPYNQPLYFHEFMRAASARGLQYVVEADFPLALLDRFPEKVQAVLKDCPLIQREQYMDFLRGQKFRATLLCHQGVPLQRDVCASQVKQYYTSLQNGLKVDRVDLRSESPARFTQGNHTIDVGDPVAKAAVMYLKETFPSYVSFQDLFRIGWERAAAARLKTPPDPVLSEATLTSLLLTGYSYKIFDLCLTPPTCASQANVRPQANPLARLQAAEGLCITSQRHQPTTVNELQRRVILRLDGKHDRASIAREVKEALASGELIVKLKDQPDKPIDTKTIAALVDEAIGQLSAAALLVE